jgi:hypothetical protein
VCCPPHRAFLAGAGTTLKPKTTLPNLTVLSIFPGPRHRLRRKINYSSMEAQHNSRALRPRHNGKPPVKQIVTAAVKKTVSVAAVFKKPQPTSRDDKIRPHKPVPKPIAKHVSDDKVRSHKSRSSSHSPHKAGSRVSKKKSALHPLAIAFKSTSPSQTLFLYFPSNTHRHK